MISPHEITSSHSGSLEVHTMLTMLYCNHVLHSVHNVEAYYYYIVYLDIKFMVCITEIMSVFYFIIYIL